MGFLGPCDPQALLDLGGFGDCDIEAETGRYERAGPCSSELKDVTTGDRLQSTTPPCG